MASSSKIYIDIVDVGDMVIRLIEHENDDEKLPVRPVTDFLVVRKAVAENSPWFKVPLYTKVFAEAEKDIVEARHDSSLSMELLLRKFHDTFIDESYNVGHPELWNLISMCDK